MDRVICPTCESEGNKSRVISDGSSSTLLYSAPYWDEEGLYHHHDGNTRKNYFHCSKGHKWETISKNECPAGDYP